MKERPQCHICHSSSDFLLTKDGYDEYECTTCGLIFVHPQPTADELAHLYSSRTGYQRGKIKKASKHFPIHETYRRIIMTLQQHNVVNVLDVGCSSGDFLTMAESKGLEAIGVEPNDITAADARDRGLTVYSGTLDTVDLPQNSFAAVHAGDVIEHVPSPREFIDQLCSVTANEGHIIIVTPNINCFWAKATRKLHEWLGLPWSVITPPLHLWQFSDHNLDRMMREYDCMLVTRWYNHLPNLRYELGSTHALKAFKKNRSIKSAAILLSVLVLYPLLFGINYVTKLLRQRDMGMVSVYQFESQLIKSL